MRLNGDGPEIMLYAVKYNLLMKKTQVVFVNEHPV